MDEEISSITHEQKISSSFESPKRPTDLMRDQLDKGKAHSVIEDLANSAPPSESEKVEDQKYIEQARNAGDYYVSFIQNTIGNGEINYAALERLPSSVKDTFTEIQKTVQSNLAEQSKRFKEQEMDAVKLLRQVYKTPQYDDALSDPTKFRLETFREGMYAVHVDAETYKLLRRGAQAVAVKPNTPDAVSFLMIRDTDGDYQQQYLKENIPHEAHHLAWQSVQKKGLFTSTEDDPLLQGGYSSYQDELLARLCSDGTLSAYTALRLISADDLEKLKQEKPQEVQLLEHNSLEANDYLEEFREELSQSSIKKSDLILPVMQSRSFGELRANLDKMRDVVRQNQVQPTEPVIDGWGTTTS